MSEQQTVEEKEEFNASNRAGDNSEADVAPAISPVLEDQKQPAEGEGSDEEVFPCAYCKKMTHEFSCQDCGEVYYCSEDHANRHWTVHKTECKGLKKDLPPQPPTSEDPKSKQPTVPSSQPQVQLSPMASKPRNPPKGGERVSVPAAKISSAMERVQLIGNRRLTQQPQDASSPIRSLQRTLGRAEGKDDDDEVHSDENDPMDPNLPKPKARRRILYHLWKGNYTRAREYAEGQYVKARVGLDKADNDVEYSAAHLDDIMQDFLMYAKCLMLAEGSSQETVREILHILSENILSCIKINYKEVKNSMAEESAEATEHKKSYRDFDSYSVSGKAKSVNMHRRVDTTDFSDFKRILHMHGIIAAFYKLLENQVESEKTYARYCKIVEKLFGIQTVEASNCYYYVGIYYYEEQQYEKALICMKKALFNRTRELGERHVSCSDCHFNIGIIYKRLTQSAKAKMELELALGIRREGIGKSSLPCAAVLEELGKLCLETGDYKNAFSYLQECYEIRKKLIKNAKHIDITRVSLLLIFLNRKIEKELRRNTDKDRIQYERNVQLTSVLTKSYPVYSAESGRKSTQLANEPLPTASNPSEEDLKEGQPPVGSEILETFNYTPPKTEPPTDWSVADFAPKGLHQIFKYHSEEPSLEAIIDIAIFLLSLDKMQMEYMNKLQVDWQGTSPLFINHEFKSKLSPYQMSLLSKADLLRTPRKLFLKKPEEMVELQNLKLTEAVLRHRSLKIRDGATLSEKNIYKLLQLNSDFYKVLNCWQVEIMNKVTALNLPLGLFIRCIQENQIQMFEATVEQELKALEEHDTAKDAYQQLPLFYKTEGKTYDKELLSIPPNLDIQDEIIAFIDRKLTQPMLAKVVFDINEEFCKNLNHDQMLMIAQLNLAKQNPDSPSKDWTTFSSQFKEFVRSLNQKEAYQFAVVNSFLLGMRSAQPLSGVPLEEDKNGKALSPIKEEKKLKDSAVATPFSEEKKRSERKTPADPNLKGFESDNDDDDYNGSEGEDEDMVAEGEEDKGKDMGQLEKEQENSQMVQSILQNPTVLDEMKKSLPKNALKTISAHPEIIKQFLTKMPRSPSGSAQADSQQDSTLKPPGGP